ncbi:hypothetical protein V9T40_008928 [Parthenolecanium corni]|uniref:Zinc finger SWIM domain-containing protein 6 n=1 Tax=Parthenolecanium corni TaxID=536013 RepID=A0AAN9Y8B5_9HEMI
MDRQQLQKFVQYLISKHHTEVLPTAQQLADEILQQRSEINRIPGAPDPTAGASADDDHTWHLDEEQVCERVKAYLQGGYFNSNKPLHSLFAKVREMLRARDSNGARMLTLITEQFLSDPRLALWKSQSQGGAAMTEKYRQLWDQLGALWVCIVLNPDCTPQEKQHWKDLLEKWSRIDVCPQEDPDYRQPPPPPRVDNYHRGNNNYHSSDSSSDEEEENSYRGNNNNGSSSSFANSNNSRPFRKHRSSWSYYNRESRPRTIFHRALDAVSMTWDNAHLKNILMSDTYCSHIPDTTHHSGSFNSIGHPLWHEPLPTCAARIDALRSHGHYEAALRLAVSVVRTMKYNQENSRKKWHDNQPPSGCSSSRCTENHRSSPRFMPYGDHRSSPHCPPRCYDPRIRSPGPIRGPDQNGYDSHHRSSPICNSRCYCSDTHSRNLSCSPRSSYVDSYSRYSCSPRCTYNESYARSPVGCSSYRSSGSFGDSHRSGLCPSRGSSGSSSYYDSHRLSPCNIRPSSRGCECRHSSYYSKQSTSSINWTDGWIGHPLDPVGCIFDTLAEASLILDDNIQFTPSFFDPLNSDEAAMHMIPRYHHVPVIGSRDRTETYLTLAVELALMALGQQRIMPPGLYAQEKACKQEDRLITRLQEMEIAADNTLIAVLRRQALILLDGGPSSGLGLGIHPESVPMHTFARFLFLVLLNYYPDLAYDVGLRAMRLPVLEDHEDADDPVSSNVSSIALSRYPRWFTIGHIETQQCALASTMLSAAKGEPLRLNTILESAQRHIHSSSHLFKLAQDAFRFATPETGPRHQKLLEVAFELGLQVMRMTVASLHWKRRDMVRWLVTCAVEVGFQALISIMQNWQSLFTPLEAANHVAFTIMAHSTMMRLNLNYHDQEVLASQARSLALQCTTKDPPNCALNTLHLCENNGSAYESAYQIVLHAAASHVIQSSQLFNIARYMETRGFPTRAYKLAMLAMKNVHLQYNQDTHPAINDIHWACALSHSLGIKELSQIIPLVTKNVQCATVLSDVLRRCSMTPPGLTYSSAELSKHHHHHHHHHHRGHHSSNVPVRPNVKPLSYDRPPLKQLLEAAITAYTTTTHSRLMHISPRHYGDFIEFLVKAHETFKLAPDGDAKFADLVENMKLAYKGKKKLMFLVKERFG